MAQGAVVRAEEELRVGAAAVVLMVASRRRVHFVSNSYQTSGPNRA